MITQDQLRQIVNELPARERSSLEPYRELIFELRSRKCSYRQISSLLAERCGIRICHSAIHDFVKRCSFTPPQRASSASREENRSNNCAQDVRERIAALKRKSVLDKKDEAGFQ